MKCNWLQKPLVLLAMCWVGFVAAGSRSYHCSLLLPNGERMPFQDEVAGTCGGNAGGGAASDSPCANHAVSLQGNPFGKDFAAEGYEWTTKLCEMDSDGDGHSNGAELGDPCCIWHQDVEMPHWMMDWNVSHPGFANSTLDPPEGAVDIEKLCKGAKKLPTKKFYNEGEAQVKLEYSMKGLLLNANDTADMANLDMLITRYFAFNFPDNQTLDVVGVEHPENDSHILVSYEVSSCPESVNERGQPNQLDTFDEKCLEVMHVWGPGEHLKTVFPKNTGMRVGKGTKRQAFYVKAVYRLRQAGIDYDADGGVIFHTTPDLRVNELGSIRSVVKLRLAHAVGETMFASHIFQLRVDKEVAPDGVRLVGYAPNLPAHLNGCKAFAEKLHRTQGQDTEVLDSMSQLGQGEVLGRDEEWYNNSQIVLRGADYISTTCTYDTSRKSTSKESFEWCMHILYYYPAHALDQVLQYTGPRHIGTLSQGEYRPLKSFTDILARPDASLNVPQWRKLYLEGVFVCNPNITLGGMRTVQTSPGVTDVLFYMESRCKENTSYITGPHRLDFSCSEDCAIMVFNMLGCALLEDAYCKTGKILSLFPSPLEPVMATKCREAFTKLHVELARGQKHDLNVMYNIYAGPEDGSLIPHSGGHCSTASMVMIVVHFIIAIKAFNC